MAFVGVVDRIMVGVSGNGRPAALFAFDDVLMLVRLGMGGTLGIGGRPGKRDQARIQEITGSGIVTPDAVQQRWPDALIVATSDIRAASLKRSAQGALYGIRRLSLDMGGSTGYAVLVPRAAQEPLRGILSTVLGERFKPY